MMQDWEDKKSKPSWLLEAVACVATLILAIVQYSEYLKGIVSWIASML